MGNAVSGITNAWLSTVQALLVAVFGVLQVFDVWTMTDDQRGAVLVLYAAVAAVVTLLNTTYGKPAKIRAAARKQGVDV